MPLAQYFSSPCQADGAHIIDIAAALPGFLGVIIDDDGAMLPLLITPLGCDARFIKAQAEFTVGSRRCHIGPARRVDDAPIQTINFKISTQLHTRRHARQGRSDGHALPARQWAFYDVFVPK